MSWRTSEWTSGRVEDRLQRLEHLRRGWILSPGSPVAASILGHALVVDGQLDEAREVAVTTDARGAHMTAETLFVAIDLAEARPAAALARARRTLEESHRDRTLGPASIQLPILALGAARLLGRSAETARYLREQLLDGEPRLSRYFSASAQFATTICLAESPERAPSCLARVRALIDERFFSVMAPGTTQFLDGAVAYIRGDYASASATWRSLLALSVASTRADPGAMADAFVRASVPEMGDRAYDAAGERHASIRGADWWFPSAALHFAARGNPARARQYAEAFVNSWALADEAVPAVAEMRALLARLPR